VWVVSKPRSRTILGDQVGHRVDAEDEADVPGVVPAVQVHRLGEVGVAPQQERAEAGPPAQLDRPVEEAGRHLVRGAVAAAVGQEQRLGGVGQRDHQRVVAPGPVVGQVDALLAGRVGADDRAVGVDDRLIEEPLGLLSPDPEPGLVDGVHQVQDVAQAEPAAEVPGRGGVGDPHGAQGVEVDLVVAPQLEVLDPGPTGQDVEGDVQHVVGLVVGQVPLEQVEAAVDVTDEPTLAGDQEHGPDAAAGQSLDAVGQLILDVTGGDHGTLLFGPGAILDPLEDPPLA